MAQKLFVGIGIGASRIKVVAVSEDLAPVKVLVRDHCGNPRDVLVEVLGGLDPAEVAGLAVTGREGASLIGGRRVYESEAVEECLHRLGLEADLVVSLGGESFVVYPLGPDGQVLDYVAGNRCAAGTVEFFKQQLGRMGLTIEQAGEIVGQGKVVPLAKRCSVHCKSDCTHSLNKKKCTVADIVRTLCHNMAEKVSALVRATGIEKGRIVVIGGASANPVIIEDIRAFLPQFDVSVPAEATYLEALGAALVAREKPLPVPGRWTDLFRDTGSSFGFLPPLWDYLDRVTFIEGRAGPIRAEARYILGIDGGSTTTKVALVDTDTLEICGSHYTRTNGNPERAMKECLVRLQGQIAAALGERTVDIVGVGTTGSSGEILSVLCQTPWYHNEIIAHAYGASHFCPEVDTIFEIGGQDSKFTSLRAKVAVDFNMNESCSAGTGSFIEETARDDLGVPMEEIAGLALAGRNPPRFSDQCAAFANTDTRKAFQEGASKQDNLAGLVYAIVENYITKVVGQRKIGNHILFQGGTSKNQAIACAFAAKTGKRITVPPHSELMGCFGIALWLREKLATREAEPRAHSIDAILETEVSATREFVCKACENFCTIQNLTIDGKTYPFGGQCSRWENARKKKKTATDELDLVAKRNRMLFREYGVPPDPGANGDRPAIGLQAVFSVYAYYPLYSWFFHELGYTVKFSERVDPLGVQKCQSARCYPYEIAHGTFFDLLSRGVRRVFVPHVVGMPREGVAGSSVSCPIAQAAPYYLAQAFSGSGMTIYDPVIDMTDGLEAAEDAFVELGRRMGHDAAAARRAFRKGCAQQHAFLRAAKDEGRRALARLEQADTVGIVVVGRPYNAFFRVANMGVPRKFASAGCPVIPYEFLPYEDEPCEPTMYWKYGQTILKSMRLVKKHPRLFAVYISNFGCGPDSFIQHFAGRILGEKPHLYLELDSHTADAGIGTRVAAYLDIISGYRRMPGAGAGAGRFARAEFVVKGRRGFVRTSRGELVPLKSPRVTLAFPSMGRYNTEALAAAVRKIGLRAVALPPADERIRAIGKEFTSGKECSPAILTVGSLISYCRERLKKERPDEVLLFFMPTANGPCRFGQYNRYMKMLIEMLRIEDVAVFSPSAEDGYRGLGVSLLVFGWPAIVASTLMADIRAVLNVAAKDRTAALAAFEREWENLLAAFSRGLIATWRALRLAARRLRRLPLKRDPASVPKVLLAGEIFVRCDELSCRGIADDYAREGLMLKRADPTEWVYYTNWQYLRSLAGDEGYPGDFLAWRFFARKLMAAVRRPRRRDWAFVGARLLFGVQRWIERGERRLLAPSGLLVTRQHDVDHIVRRGACFINPALGGEAILSAGSASVMMEHSPEENYCGVVFIGPFNCMPTGVAESVVKPYARKNNIPYLAFETDGGPMPPNFRSQMEVHMLRSRRYANEQLLTRTTP
ncbi:MAG: anhydro-N-acetylmuramic acid kinase [Kiritimatiellae bacterium]|nr:anhydro-N-acetylmuramic acid kinase [Kiritimatiellia bacterium]